MSNRFLKSLSESQFDVGAGRFQPAELGHARRHLPQVVERGQVDAPARRQPAAQARQQRADVEHAVAEAIADDRVPRRATSHAAASPVRSDRRPARAASSTSNAIPGCRARARSTISGRKSMPWRTRVGQRRQQIAVAAARLQHRRVGGISRASADCRSRSMKSRAAGWRGGSSARGEVVAPRRHAARRSATAACTRARRRAAASRSTA